MTLRIFYWPVPFRGNFIKLLLEDANVPYSVASPKEVSRLVNLEISEQKLAGMAPPYLADEKNDIFLNQTLVIMQYLAKRYGYEPEDQQKCLIAAKVTFDCLDFMSDLTQANGTKMWEYSDWQIFRNERLPRWLEIFEAIGKKHQLKPHSSYLLGTKDPTYADISVLALLATIQQCLPELLTNIKAHAPHISSLIDRLSRRARIKVFLDRQKQALGNLYCGGDIERSIREMIERDKRIAKPVTAEV